MCVCVSVCVCPLSDEASVRPENAVMCSAGSEGQKFRGVFSETVPLLRSSAPSLDGHTAGLPFVLQRTRMGIVHTQVRRDASYAIVVSSPGVLALR